MSDSLHRASEVLVGVLASALTVLPVPAGVAAEAGEAVSGHAWWAFQPLSEVQPPWVPQVRGRSGSTAVDAFLLARLREVGLEFSPEADRRTLLRRVSMDLTGLPPSAEDAQAFLSDALPDAWERLVDRLLARPEHGERWARHWLDVARFAESSGFEHDYDRPGAHHFRDFVVQALNADMPYDQFVRWQLAGDEFAPGEVQALMATGFLGAGVFPTQITANEVERTRYDAMDDMLATTGTAFLGLTIGCARCHDHKYDPISSRDYYRLLSTFTTTVRSELELDLHPDENRAVREAFDRMHAPLVDDLHRYEAAELPRRFEAWLNAGAPVPDGPVWDLLDPEVSRSDAGATFQRLEDGSLLAAGSNGDADAYTFVAAVPSPVIRGVRLEALADSSLPHGGPGRADNGNIGLSRIRVFVTSGGDATRRELPLVSARATFEQNTNSLSVASALDDDPRTGWAVDPRFGTNHAAIFLLGGPLEVAPGDRLTVRLEFELNARHNIGRVRLAVTASDASSFEAPARPPSVTGLLEAVRKGAELSAEGRDTLMTWWRTQDAGWRTLHERVESHAQRRPAPRLTKVLVCAEGYPAVRMHTQGGDFLPETHFLLRGSPEQKRGVATPGFPRVLLRGPELGDRWQWQPAGGERFSGRRRTLAAWMTDLDDGAGALLARVIVNRLWQHHFGTGIVSTPNDFGVQGARPTHPALLDWLAGQLVRGGWRLKPIHRLLVLSDAYRQSSHPVATAFEADPENLLISRRVPRRMEAEVVRDSLLAVGGELDLQRFGPGSLKVGIGRRSIYLTIKRSQLIPMLQAFDAPEPLVSQAMRPTTTVAPQALFLMNSPEVRRWAGALAARIRADPESSPGDWVTAAWWRALSRPPSAGEVAEALEFVDAQRTRQAAAGVADPDVAAWTDLAQVVLGLNEFIYVD
ncbi:MAG: DUF1549 domain-containing protein [Verrucomicrobiae bacterium]|nr:DUF1549 domain-containing protein [Verrucomicrobiae bacterium]